MSATETLARLRAYAEAHPADVAVVPEQTIRDAEGEADTLGAAWARGDNREQRLRVLERLGVDVSELRAADRAKAAKADTWGFCGLDEPQARAAVNAALDAAFFSEHSRTCTVVGMPRPVILEEEPIPLTRIVRLPLPPAAPKRLNGRPGFQVLRDMVRRVQRERRATPAGSRQRPVRPPPL